MCTLLGASVLLAEHVASASPEDIFGYGNRGPAMGGTGTSHAEGFEAAYANPALLSRIEEKKLTLGFQTATFALTANDPNSPAAANGGKISADPLKGFVIGADIPLPLRGRLRDRIALGIAFFTPTDILVRGRLLYPETPQYPLLPDRVQSLAVRLGLGVNVGHGFRVGVGFAALAELAGSVTVATDATGRVGTKVEDQLIATYSPIVGVTYDLPASLTREKIRIGAVYRGSLDARFSVQIDATKLSSLNIPVFNIAGLAQYDPAQAVLEASWERDNRIIAIGATYKRWSDYPGLLEPTIQCPADAPDCGSIEPPQISYHDTVVLHAGVEEKFKLARDVTFAARFGLRYEPSPLPTTLPTSGAYNEEQQQTVQVPTRYYDADRLIFTAGMGLTLPRRIFPLTIDQFFQVHELLPTTLTSVDPNGNVLSRGKAQGSVLASGILVGVRF